MQQRVVQFRAVALAFPSRNDANASATQSGHAKKKRLARALTGLALSDVQRGGAPRAKPLSLGFLRLAYERLASRPASVKKAASRYQSRLIDH
jgi:hypothetical protein